MTKRKRPGKNTGKTAYHLSKSMPNRGKKPAPYMMNDKYAQKAKKEGYRARSVYKLIEIQEKFDLIQPNMDICDV